MPAAVALACVAEVPEAAPVVAAVVACQLALVVAASVAAWLQVAPVAASVAACQLGPGLVAAAAAGSKSRCCFALALAKQLLQVAKIAGPQPHWLALAAGTYMWLLTCL